jgi:lipopolysaccharide transport system ATP-binding protein
MYMRLAFAVAAHLTADILFVDEVLAVGDAAFQKKCLSKMGEVSRCGRTILFVTHNLGALVQLCPRTLLLRNGKVVSLGKTETAVAEYMSEDSSGTLDVSLDPMRKPDSALVLRRCHITAFDGSSVRGIDVAGGFKIKLEVLARREVVDADVSIRVSNDLGTALFTSSISDYMGALVRMGPGKHSYEVEVPRRLLAPGRYFLHVGIHRPNIEILDSHDGIVNFVVEESGSEMWRYQGKRYGSILVNCSWAEV